MAGAEAEWVRPFPFPLACPLAWAGMEVDVEVRGIRARLLLGIGVLEEGERESCPCSVAVRSWTGARELLGPASFRDDEECWDAA